MATDDSAGGWAERTLNAIGDAVLSTDLFGRITYLNAAAERITGWPRSDAEGQRLADVFRVVDGTTRARRDDVAAAAMSQRRTVTMAGDYLLIRRDGREVPVEDSAAPIHDCHGRVAGAVIVCRDVSAARRTSARLAHLARLAQHDALTNLPNRLLLHDRLQQAIRQARRHGRRIAVLFLDLDHFKAINDSLGHAVGDRLLQAVALRLRRAVRDSDTVGRQGGDEFVVVMPDPGAPESIRATAAKLMAAVVAPHVIDGHEVQVQVSMGISIYPDDADDAESLRGNADMAMYHAKTHGGNRHTRFLSVMAGPAARRARSEMGRPGALAPGRQGRRLSRQ